MSIQQAQAALQAKRDAGELEQLDPIEKATRDPESLAAAIKAMCFECCGRGQDPNIRHEIGCCTAWGCPLWPLRPHQKLAPEGHGAEEQAAAVAEFSPRSTLASAASDPTSRRKGITAKCVECMGAEHQVSVRRLIADCRAEFPRTTATDYRGCPLWPHRPVQPDSGDCH